MSIFKDKYILPLRGSAATRIGPVILAVIIFVYLGLPARASEWFGRQQTPTDLRITILPEEAVGAGAQWRVRQGDWQPSGRGIMLDAGKHEVEFRPLQKWTEPAPLSVNVIEGHVNEKTVIYNPMNVYNIGDIPPQTVWHGNQVRFILNSDQMGAGAAFSQEIVGEVLGTVSLNASTRLFSYTPEQRDKEPFSVVFKAEAGEQITTQTVSFTPVPRIIPEQANFGLDPVHQFPNPYSSEYILEDDAASATMVSFNWADRRTRTVTIAGKYLVFEEGHPNGLYDRYNSDLETKNLDIAEMNIHGEQVIIRSPLHLPQTNVTIHARQLIFQDLPDAVFNHEMAQIITIPRDPSVPASVVSEKGRKGLQGGDMVLHIGALYFNEPDYDGRFLLKGGKGQQGGPGQNGDNGESFAGTGQNPLGSLFGNPPNWQSTIYVKQINILCYLIDGKEVCREKLVSQKGSASGWPSDGEPAKPAGVPGDPGDGGYMLVNMDPAGIAYYVNKNGGTPGTKGVNYLGGAAGNPSPAYKYTLYYKSDVHGDWSDNWVKIGSRSTSKGADAPAPEPDKGSGIAGQFVQVGNPLSWISPYALRMIVAHARDVYLYGYVEDARAVFSEYLEVLDACLNSSCRNSLQEEWTFKFEQINNELLALVHRIDSNLDYFARPAGWIPMLSFELTRKAFDNEIEHAINAMYLSYWIARAETSVIQRKQGMESMRARLKAGIDENTGILNQAIGRLPVIEVEARNIAGDVEVLQQNLMWLEEELVKKAEENVEDRHKLDRWKKTARFLGAICTISPIGQPVVGGIGQGLTILSNVPNTVTEDPWMLLKDTKYLESTVDKEFKDFNKNCGDLINAIKKVDFDNLKAFGASFNGVKQNLVPVIQTINKFNELRKEFQVPKNEVDAELQNLKASDPEFVELTDEIATLLTRKETLNRQIVDTMQIIARAPGEIQKDHLAIDELNREISGVSAVLNPRVLSYLKEIELRARERLLKYQYYMAKAFEYRRLEPYLGELNLAPLLNAMVEIAEAVDAGHTLKPADFYALKTIYEEELAGIANGILQWYIDNPPERRISDAFDLNDTEITALNNSEIITINLMDKGLFFPDEEDVRLADLSVKSDFMEWYLKDANATKATSKIEMEHSGVSRVVKAGNVLRFRHYAAATQNPLSWSGRYNGIFNAYEESKPSPATESLLKSLLYEEASDDELLIYSRPAGWADILIKKVDHPDNDSGIDIVRLPLQVTYDYRIRPASLARLAIEVSQANLRPLFTLNKADINGRADGLGAVSRFYVIGTIVQVKAPERYGSWTFSRWVDSRGEDLTTDRNVEVYLADDQLVQAVFISGDSDGDDLLDDWEWTHFGNLKQSGTGDYDKDYLANERESLLGTNPMDPDVDDDGAVDGKDASPFDPSKRYHDFSHISELLLLNPVFFKGDLNNDGCVDRDDLYIVLGYLRTGVAPIRHPSYDFNGDGVVNIADARKLVTHFTNPKGAPCQ